MSLRNRTFDGFAIFGASTKKINEDSGCGTECRLFDEIARMEVVNADVRDYLEISPEFCAEIERRVLPVKWGNARSSSICTHVRKHGPPVVVAMKT